MPQYVSHSPVDQSVATPAFLVGRTAPITHTRNDEAVHDARCRILIASKPRNCANCSRHEEKAIAIARFKSRQPFSQNRKEREAGAVVVS